MIDLTLEQTEELEKAIRLKNEAILIYKDFINNYSLNVKDFKNQMFKIWDDSNNRTYIDITENGFVYRCRFLHETYDLLITPEGIFNALKSDYRGLDHFKSELVTHKRKKETERSKQ